MRAVAFPGIDSNSIFQPQINQYPKFHWEIGQIHSRISKASQIWAPHLGDSFSPKTWEWKIKSSPLIPRPVAAPQELEMDLEILQNPVGDGLLQ